MYYQRICTKLFGELKKTFDEIKHKMCKEQEKKIKIEQLKFTRNKKRQTIQTDVEMKSYEVEQSKFTLIS